MKINNLKELEAIVIRAIETSMSNEGSAIRQSIEQVVDDTTETMVYDRYEPKNYQRRGEDGGLLGADIEATKKAASANSLTYEIEQNALGNFTGIEYTEDLAPTINEGWGDKMQPYNKPSQHLDFLNENLASALGSDALKSIKSDLRTLGYDVK